VWKKGTGAPDSLERLASGRFGNPSGKSCKSLPIMLK